MLRNFIRSFRRKSRYPFAGFLCIGIFPASAHERTVPWATPRISAASATFTYSLSFVVCGCEEKKCTWNLASRIYPNFSEKSSHSREVGNELFRDCGLLRLFCFSVEHRDQFAGCVATGHNVERPCFPPISSALTAQNPEKTGHLPSRPHMCPSRELGKHWNASAGAHSNGQAGTTAGRGGAFRTCGETASSSTPPVSRFLGISRHCG